MVMYFKQYFLILPSFCILSSLAMENTLNVLNEKLTNELRIAQNNFNEENLNAIKGLLEQKADVNLQVRQKTALMLAIQLHNSNFVNYLLEHGADPNISCKNGWTSLHIALEQLKLNPDNFDIQIITDLLTSKANSNAKTRDFKTPLSLAITTGNLDLVECLIKHKADVNLKNGYSTPLGQSIATDNCIITQELLKHGASLIELDKVGNTAFHYLVGKPKEYIETVITHAFFENQNQKLHENEERLKAIFIVLRCYYNIPKDLTYLIAAKLLENPFSDTNIKFSLDKGFTHLHALYYVENHIQQINKILEISSQDCKKALQFLYETYSTDIKYINDVKHLFNKNTLEKDFDELNYSNTPQTNLALQIYNNYTKLLYRK